MNTATATTQQRITLESITSCWQEMTQREPIISLAYRWGTEDALCHRDNEASQYFEATDKRFAEYVAGFVAGCWSIGRIHAAIAAQSILHGGKHVETYQTLQAAGA